MLIILLIFSSILFMKLLLNRMNRYIDENGKSSMGAVVEQIQQTYELQVNGYYSQLHLVEDYILKEKEVSPETDANQNFFEAWEKEAGSRRSPDTAYQRRMGTVWRAGTPADRQ